MPSFASVQYPLVRVMADPLWAGVHPRANQWVQTVYNVCGQTVTMFVGKQSQCLWAGVHPEANQYQQASLPIFQRTTYLPKNAWCFPTRLGLPEVL